MSPPVFSQFAIANYLENFDWRAQIVILRCIAPAAMQRCKGWPITCRPPPRGPHPTGGFFVWLTLPEGLDSQALLARAVNERVAYVPGNAFYADGFGSRNMRLSYCFPDSGADHEDAPPRQGDPRRVGDAGDVGLPATDTPHTPVIGPAPDLS